MKLVTRSQQHLLDWRHVVATLTCAAHTAIDALLCTWTRQDSMYSTRPFLCKVALQMDSEFGFGS